MQRFRAALEERQSDPSGRRWLYVPYDQLSAEIGPLAREEPEELGIVLIESVWKAKRRPYHRQKLALVLANQRQFALEQAERGVAVDYVATADRYSSVLEKVFGERGPLRVMEPAERELRADLWPLMRGSSLEVLEHEGWLTRREQFEASRDRRGCYRMDSFYRRVRRDSGVLMDGGKPVGGRFSFDAANRRPWRGEPEPPAPPTFDVDAVTAEVGESIEQRFSDHPGELHLDRLPTTRGQAEATWSWAKQHCLKSFGPYEDAMSRHSSGLFHTRISSLLNLHRLLPRRVLEVEEHDAPLESREGLIRQVLGWREFVHWVHVATDGFRRSATPEENAENEEPAIDDGAGPSFLGADRQLPATFWGQPSGLACLDHVVAEVWREGYSHHINRLMVLANIATLIDISPRELSDWFWVAYTDAYDWVVEPNVLGMGTFALGDLMTTKPYIAGSNYIQSHERLLRSL